MREIDFQFPQAAFLIILVALIFFLQFFLYQYRQRQIQSYAESRLLPHLLQGRSKIIESIKMGLWVAIWILACAALMSPEGNVHYLPVTQTPAHLGVQTHEIIFLVDTSASMGVLDGESGQSRLEDAKAIIQNLISRLKNTNVAIYAFTSTLTPLVPQTLDYLFTRLIVRGIHINEGDVGGTRFQPVLEKLKDKILSDSIAHGHSVVLLSDGGDNQVYGEENTSMQALSAILEAIPDPKILNLTIFAVGVGQPEPTTIPNVTTEQGQAVTSRLQSELLIKLADHTHGYYYEASHANNWAISSRLLSDLKKNFMQQKHSANNERKVVPALQDEKISDLYYQIPLGIAIIFFLGGLLVSEI